MENKKSGKIKGKEEDEEKPDDTIGKLIQRVDGEWRSLNILKQLQVNFKKFIYLIAVIAYAIIAAIVIWKLLPFVTQEPTLFLAIVLTICSFIVQFVLALKELSEPLKKEEVLRITAEWNYHKIKDRVKDEHQLLLKALIRMRTLQEDFKLSEVRRKYPSLFNEEKIVGSMLYGLSPLPVDISEKKASENP